MPNTKEKTLFLELSAERPIDSNYYYAQLSVPAKDYEITDALQRIRAIDGSHGYLDISILECPLLPELEDVRLDSPTIDELNFFAKRLADLNEDEKIILQAVIPRLISDEDEDQTVSMKDLINITYGLDVSIISNVWSDEQLGEFVIENDIHEDVASVPDNALYLLDRKQVGALQRNNDGGVFVGHRYIIAGEYEMPEIYDGMTLPKSEPTQWFAFQLDISEAPVNDSEETSETAEWISLPIDKAEADRIARTHNEGCIEDCVYYDFESSVPQITEEMFGDMLNFDKLNSLAELMAEMSPNEQLVFKAVLSAEQPKNIENTLDIAKRLSEYELSYYAEDSGDFYKQYLSHNLDTRFDCKWLDTLLTRNEGARLIDRLGASVTDYGIISDRGRSLYELVSYDKPEETIDTDYTQSEENEEYEQSGGMTLE